jgi:hypothetical protein
VRSLTPSARVPATPPLRHERGLREPVFQPISVIQMPLPASPLARITS